MGGQTPQYLLPPERIEEFIFKYVILRTLIADTLCYEV